MASGIMVAGKWLVDGNERTQNGEFHEIPTTFRHYIIADGSSGFQAEPGRYHLYVALGCPWAHRTLIMRMLDVEFAALGTQKIDLFPPDLQQQIDGAIDAIYTPINRGVYRAGFATSQAAYEQAVTELFEGLDRWEIILSKQHYLCGNFLTEADICMFVTLYRFDSVYYGHFKCNLRRIIDYPHLWNYLKYLYQRPEFKVTCNLDHIKRGYYMSMPDINPNGIVPTGPIIDFEEACDTYGGKLRS